MKALIAFIVMAILVLTLIEINERVKKSKVERQKTAAEPLKDEECQKEQSGQEDCSGCGLIDVCEKEEKKKTGR